MGMRRHGPDLERQERSRPVGVLLRRLFGYLGGFKRELAIGATFSVLGTVVGVFDIPILSQGLDAVLSAAGGWESLILLIGLYVALKVTAWALNGGKLWFLAGAQAGLTQNVQSDVYDHLINADLSYHTSQQSGDVTSRVTSDVDQLSMGVQVLIDFASHLLLMVASFFIVWSISQTLALTTLVVVPGVLFIAVLFGTIGQRIMLDSRRAYGRVSGQIAENLAGVHVAKAFNREDELSERMSELNQEAYNYGFKFMMLLSAMQPLMRSIGQFGIAAVLFVGGSLAVGTTTALTVGELFVGITMTSRFMWPLLALSMNAAQVQSSLAAMDRISDVTEKDPSITEPPESKLLQKQSDGIEFRNVNFSYVADELVLKDVSFTVNPGETVAVVGHTGAGKTTVAALINRFYDPDSGQILIGGQDLRNITLDSLHDEVSLIPQEPYLFDGTVIENIRYGKPSATEDEIVEICKLIGADEFIDSLPDGYHTKMIQGGKNVSSGQKQMITIARTMLADPKILILDEATSRLDAYSESLVQDAQAKLFSGRTTVVVAHRLTTIANASRILVFEEGEIVERGTHEELLELGGVFKRLYDTYYAHQGIEELSETIASTAAKEVSKCPDEVKAPVAESSTPNPKSRREDRPRS